MHRLIMIVAACTIAAFGLGLPARPAAATDPATLPQDEARLVDAINAARDGNGLPVLYEDPLLDELARYRAGDQAARDYFSHTTPDGQTAFDLLQSAGVTYTCAGEILAESSGQDPVAAAMRGFMDSQEHRDNLLGTGFSRFGVGAAGAAGGLTILAVIFSN